MNQFENLGMAFANIVCKFLEGIDCADYDASLHRMFECSSREKKTLVAFLMRKKTQRYEYISGYSSGKWINETLTEVVTENSDLTVRCDPHGERTESTRTDDMTETPGLTLLERSIETNGIVTQLTVVRNTFIKCLLGTRDSPTTRAASSLPTYDALQQIPVECSGGLTGSGVKSIETLIASLSNRLMRSHQFNSGNRSSLIERGVGSDNIEQYDYSYAQMLSSTVEILWAFSIGLILAEEDSVLIRSTGLVHCARFVLRNRSYSRVRKVSGALPRLCDLPPVFFLSLDLAINLETHFHSILLNAGSCVLLPFGMYHLLLSHSCYGLLCQIDEQAVDDVWKGLVQTCASVMKTARLTCRSWENVNWGDIISKTGLSSSCVDYESLAQDMESIWIRRQKWWEDSTKDTSRAADVTWANRLPIFLNGTLPSFLPSHMQEVAEFLSNMYSSLKGNNNNKSDKTIGDNFHTLFCGTMQLCHIFNNQSVMQGFLKDFLDIVKRMLTCSKKDKRVREVVSLILCGCFFFNPGTYDGRRRDAQQMEVTLFQPLVESILSEVNNWCKPKHAMWYSIAMSSLLGGCSMKTLAERLPIFFETMGLWLASADNTDRIAIIYSTLHAGGLLCDVCTNPTTTSLFEWGRSIEAYCNCVEKMLLRSIGDESWEETQQIPSTVAAASELLMFSLQQEPFHSRACQWLMKLLEVKIKVKFALKGCKGTPISRGQLIAMRTISALCGLQYFPRHHFIGSKRSGTRDSNLVCSTVMEYESRMNVFFSTSTEPKGHVKDRIVSLITIYGSYYNPAVTTIEGATIFWRSVHLENVLRFVKQAREIPRIINELRETSFVYIRHISTEGQSVETLDRALQLINIILASQFWVAPEIVLDKHLTLPMILVGAKTPLYEAVSRVILPFYLNNKNDGNMSSSALALHRLAECIITLLVNDDDDHVEHLAEYMITHLAILRDRMEFMVNHELYASKTEIRDAPLTMESHQREISRDEKNEKEITSCRSRWNWLLNVMDTNLQLSDDSSTMSSSSAQDWCAITGLRGVALIDTLEGLSVVLLGHSRRQVRRIALIQLELLASLLHLHRIHCESASRAALEARNVNVSNGVHMSSTSFNVTSNYSPYNTEVSSSRLALADIFTDLSEQFSDMYASQKEHYMPLIRQFDLKLSISRHSIDEKWVVDSKRMCPRESFSSTCINLQEKLRLCRKSTKRNISLSTAPFGVRCLSEDSSPSLFIFISTTALCLTMYGYCPGSAVVPVACAITGEVVEKGLKRYMERNSSVWRSCYAFYFLLICVDNAKVSPDANRLTRGIECNRPGHQQCGKSIYLGGPDDTSDVGWQIMNRHEKYQRLMKNITLPLILHEINGENNTPYFVDMLQFLLVGPLETASTGVSSLVTFSGLMDSDHPIVKALSEILAQLNSKTRKNKQHVVNACLVILIPMLIIIGRRYFVKPPATPGRMQDTVATKRTIMETILKDFINSILLGEHVSKEYGDELERERRLTIEDLGKTLSEGNGVSVNSWLALPFIPPTVSQGDNKNQSNHELYLEIRPIILLRGLLCDLIGLVYCKETKYLEPHLKNNLLPKVLYSLTHQVHWFLQGHMSARGSVFKSKSPKSLFIVMEKSIIALKSVVSSSELSQGYRYAADYKNIISTFAEKFFKWLQQASQTEYYNLEKSSPRIFDLAVTLLLADTSSLEYARRVLCELPIGSPVHRTFFAVLVTALSAKSNKPIEHLPCRRQTRKVESSYTKTEVTSNDTFSAPASASLRFDSSLTELTWNPCIIFYSLAYLYEDVNAGCVFDAATRFKAQSFLMLLCGESPSELSQDALDDWLCLLLKTYHHSRGELEHTSGLVQHLFKIASGDILSAQRKSNNPVQVQRIALKLLTLFLRRVEPTKANLRIVLQVTQSCRNSISEYALAELWGGWIAYEGRERERFVSLLVTIPMELSEKRIVTNYIDSYIAHELTKQGKAHSGKLDGRSRGAYYSFLLFSFYQMKSLRSKVIESIADNNFKNDTVDTLLESIRDDEIRPSSTVCLSRSFSQAESQANKKISQGGAARRKSLWVMEENIWQSNTRFSMDNAKSDSSGPFMRERPIDHGASSVSSEIREDVTMLREVAFIRPLVSVLFFASWAIERLQLLGWRLWKELDRDLGTISSFMRKESLVDAKGVSGYCPSYTSALAGEAADEAGYGGNNNNNNNKHKKHKKHKHNNTTTSTGTTATNNSSNNNSSSASDESLQVVGDESAEEEVERVGSHAGQTPLDTHECYSSENEQSTVFYADVSARGGGGGVASTTVNNNNVDADSEQGSDDTMIVHGNIPAKSFRETIETDMKRQNKFKKDARRQQQQQEELDSKTGMAFRLLQRDFLSLFLHFACMLLVHLGCGEVRRSDGRDELLLRFRVVEASFEALGGQLKGATSEASYRAPSTLKHWLKLTLARIQQRNVMAQRDEENHNNASSNNNNNNNNNTNTNGNSVNMDNNGGSKGFFGNCGDALFHDMSLLFEQAELDESLADSASSATDVVLSELFLSIAGQGRNIRGRRFLLRCLHESTTWIQHGGYASLSEMDARLRLPIPYSYISLLSMKIARSLSSSLAFTTGVLLVSCDGRRLWMEKTAMQLAEASALRRILAALASHMRSINHDVHTSLESSLLSQDQMWCTSVLTSLSCLLRDIIVHETYYCTRTRSREAENDKPEEMVLTTVFGVNSAFPTRYLLLCFWIGFSFLLKSNIWHEACNLLAIFHRYGCSRYLGHISVPTISPLNHLCVNVAADCLAVQLVLFHQGKSVINRQKSGSIISLYDFIGKSSPTNDSVLNFLNEYAKEKDESALFLAFSELLVLCDWDFINVETNAPRFMAFVNKININGCQGKSNRGTSSLGDSNCLGSSVSNSFTRYFCSFVDLWKQCLVKFPSEQEWTLQSLCTRMIFLLKEFFLMGAKAFGVSSIDVLLHRVVLTKNNYRGSHATGLSQSRSHTTDLCSLHSCTESVCDKHRLSEESVALFQHLFESLVMTPFMLLFQSSKTPLSLWSKILALIAALLSFHKQNHGYVTDLLLKFLPYLERGLSVDSTRNSVVDETPLFERFAVFFLADEVSEKLKSLKNPVHAKVPVRVGCDSRKQPPSLVSLVDDENLIAALIEYIAKDSFSVNSTKGAAQSVSSQSVNDPSAMQASSLHTEEGGGVLPLIINANKETSPNNNDNGKELQTAECEQLKTSSSGELESSSLCVKKKSTFATPFLSHRFGEYVYEVSPGSNGGVEMLDQLPLECYRRPLLQRDTGPLLDVAISAENNKENCDGEGEDVNTHEHKPLGTRTRPFHSDLNQGFIPRDENRVFPVRQHERTATSLSTLDGGEFSDTDSDYMDSS